MEEDLEVEEKELSDEVVEQIKLSRERSSEDRIPHGEVVEEFQE